jgi:S-adenosyl methyltransferase
MCRPRDSAFGYRTTGAPHDAAGHDVQCWSEDRSDLGNVLASSKPTPANPTTSSNPELRVLIDLDQPVAVLLVAMLHLLPDGQNPTGIVTHLRDALALGSCLALTHCTSDALPDLAAKIADEFARLQITTPLIPRTHAQILRFFDGFDLVEPGLVFPTLWRPDPPPAEPDPGAQSMHAGVGRKASGA